MNPFSKIIISIVLLFLSGFVSINQAEESNTKMVEMKQFLVAGPLQVKSPAIINSDSEKFKAKGILEYKYKDIKNWWPQEDDKFLWDSNTSAEWEEFETTDKHGILLDTEKDGNSLYYLAAYINTETYFKGKIKLSSNHLFEVYADGNKICSKTKSDSEKPKEEDFISGTLSLEPGNHLIIIKALYDTESTLPWGIKVKLESDSEYDNEMISTSVNPERRMTLEHFLDIPEIKGVSLSSDGKYAAITYRQIKDDNKSYNYWIDVLNPENGKALFPKRVVQNISSLKWIPKSSKFSYTISEGKNKSINLVDLKSGATETILENIENLSDYNWAPDASFVIYAITEKPKEDKEGLKKIQGMPDRWPTWRDKDELYLLDVKTRTNHQLTKSKNSSYLYDIHPDSDKILLMQSVADYVNRPYFKSYLYMMDLNTMWVDSIWSGHWLNSAFFSPDGKKLLVTGGPSLFDGIGKSISADKIHHC